MVVFKRKQWERKVISNLSILMPRGCKKVVFIFRSTVDQQNISSHLNTEYTVYFSFNHVQLPIHAFILFIGNKFVVYVI